MKLMGHLRVPMETHHATSLHNVAWHNYKV